jgi:co-chaperonin GroES (HSP10)
MGFPTSDVGYTSATTGRGDHEFHKGYVVALGKKKKKKNKKNKKITLNYPG